MPGKKGTRWVVTYAIDMKQALAERLDISLGHVSFAKHQKWGNGQAGEWIENRRFPFGEHWSEL